MFLPPGSSPVLEHRFLFYTLSDTLLHRLSHPMKLSEEPASLIFLFSDVQSSFRGYCVADGVLVPIFFFFLAGSYLLTQQYISHGCKRASLVYEIKQVYFVLISTFILLFMVDIFIRRILFIELKFYLYLLELLVSSNINDDNVTFLIHNIYLNLGYCRIFYKILNTVIGHTV